MILVLPAPPVPVPSLHFSSLQFIEFLFYFAFTIYLGNNSATVTQRKSHCFACSGLVFDVRLDRNLKMYHRIGIRNEVGAEPQSIVYTEKYSWIKSQIPPQCICWEAYYVILITICSSVGTLNPTAHLMHFDKNRAEISRDCGSITSVSVSAPKYSWVNPKSLYQTS